MRIMTAASSPTILTGPLSSECLEELSTWRRPSDFDACQVKCLQGNPDRRDVTKIGLMALDSPSDSMEQLVETAKFRLRNGDYASGLFVLLARRNLVDKNASASALLGVLAGRLNLSNLSIAALGNAVRLEPTVAPIREAFAQSLADANDYEGACDQLIKAVEIEPNAVDIHEELIHLLLTAGKFEDAFARANLALSNLCSGNINILVYRGIARRGLGQHQAAEHDFHMARNIDPNCTLALLQMFSMAIEDNDLEKAANVASELFTDV